MYTLIYVEYDDDEILHLHIQVEKEFIPNKSIRRSGQIYCG
jgi:hypothetical protein